MRILPNDYSALFNTIGKHMQDTGLHGCQEGSSASMGGPCKLTEGLQFGPATALGTDTDITCPTVQLTSFLNATAKLPPALQDLVTLPFPQPRGGGIHASPSFTNFHDCSCNTSSAKLTVVDGRTTCTVDHSHKRWVLAVVLVAVLPQVVLALSVFAFIR